MSYNAQFVSALKEALNGLRTIHSVGEEWCSYIGKIPTGGVPYCGQEVTRSTYSALWSYAQAQGLVKSESEWQAIYSAQGGNVPYYSSGDGSSTFRMPRLVGYVRGASGQSEAGAYVKEGLPNITANVRQVRSTAGQNASSTGALYWASLSETYPNNAAQKTDYTYGNGLLLDASLSSSVYGSSDHVTPETSVVLFGVYAFGEVSNVDALDAGALASALARVESNLETKLDDGDKGKIAGWSIPDYSSSVVLSEGGTVPKDAMVYVTASGSGKCSIKVFVNGVEAACNSTYGDGNPISCSLFVAAGSVITTTRTSASTYSIVYFPLRGAK